MPAYLGDAQMRLVLAAVALLSTALPSLLASPDDLKKGRDPKVTVFVGPREREGFVDVDSGILDSIKDIQEQIRSSPKFALVPTAREAKINLTVIGRRTPGDSGGVGVPLGAGMTMMIPIKRRAIDLVLRVGTYEKAIVSEAADGDDRWSSAAKRALKDLTAWADGNRLSLVDAK